MIYTTSQVKQTYDQIGSSFSTTRPKLSPEVISLLPRLSPDSSVLDLGCGNGVLLTALGEDINYTGLDFSQTLINEAKKLHSENNFLLADISSDSTWADLPQFDFIAALAVFHHLPTRDDHLKLLRNIKQHLSPTGNCLISVWNLNQSKFAKYKDAGNSRLFSIPFHHGPKRDFYAFELTELPSLATQQAGFTNIKTTTARENFYYHLA